MRTTDNRGHIARLLIGLYCLIAGVGCEEVDRSEFPEETVVEREIMSERLLRDSTSYLTMEPNPKALRYGTRSAGDLVELALRAVSHSDTTTLADIAVSAEEWREILYPEMGLYFPGARDSRPEVLDLLGELHFNSSIKGLRRLLRDYGGQIMQPVETEISGDTLDFPSFTLYTEPVIHVRLEGGSEGKVAFLGSIVEKDGFFKLLSYREAD